MPLKPGLSWLVLGPVTSSTPGTQSVHGRELIHHVNHVICTWMDIQVQKLILKATMDMTRRHANSALRPKHI